VQALEREGVDTVFAYPGGASMEIHQALTRSKTITNILCRHEQGEIFAAEGYAKATGRVGVCIATSGPGATNLVTGLADAMMDSVPLVAITGQVPRRCAGSAQAPGGRCRRGEGRGGRQLRGRGQGPSVHRRQFC
jgi:acetolactate synthase-1/2/3 large subunit